MSLARFTPSLLDEDTLESLFVHRGHLVDEAVGRISRAAATTERAHQLFVGPRGAGKTHLISLIYYRSRRQTTERPLQMCWLPEDPWTIASYEDFITAILENVEPASLLRRTDSVRDAMDSSELENTIVRLAAQGGPLIVLAENFDQILGAIGNTGQRRLRALLENQRPLLLVATATRTTKYLLDQAEPFYGFFDTTTLRPFDIDQAGAMLQAIARLQGNQTLEHRLNEPSARARLAAVQHLAGGQPRVWALLGAGLTARGLDELVSALVERFDDLTPYYQLQLAHLSAHELKVVKALAEADRAMNVRVLAEVTRIAERSVARTLTDLRRQGWVRAREGLLVEMVDRRLTFYELAEPLARLAFQIKAARGRPVKLVLDFLAAWYDQQEILTAQPVSILAKMYLSAAVTATANTVAVIGRGLTRFPSFENYIATEITATTPTIYATRPDSLSADLLPSLESLDDAVAAYQQGDALPLLGQPISLSQLIEHRLASANAVRVRLDIAMLAVAAGGIATWRTIAEAILASADAADHTASLLLIIITRAHDELDGSFRALIEAVEAALLADPRPQTVEDALRAAVELLHIDAPNIAAIILGAITRNARPEQLLQLAMAQEALARRTGRLQANLAQWERTVDVLSDEFDAHHVDVITAKTNLALNQAAAGRPDKGIRILRELLSDTPKIDNFNVLATQSNLAYLQGEAGDPKGAAEALSRVLAHQLQIMDPDEPAILATRNNLALWQSAAGDPVGAIAAFAELLADHERIFGPDHPDTLAVRESLALSRGQVGDHRGGISALEAVVKDRLRLFGPDHPYTLATRNRLAFLRGEAGDHPGAVAALEGVLADRLRVLGPHHPDTLGSRNNLAVWRGEAGDIKSTVLALEELLDDVVQVLGPDHPNTLGTRYNIAKWRAKSGDLVGSASAFEAVLADQLRILGPEHPATLRTGSHFAYLLEEAGDFAGAAAAFEALFAAHKQILGPDHPSTLRTRNNLANIQMKAGDFAAASAAFEVLLTDHLRVLGPDHPSTLRIRNNLAYIRMEVGEFEGLGTELEGLLAHQLRFVGPNDLETFFTRDNLVRWRGKSGDLQGAAAVCAALLADRSSVLGPKHPDTLRTRRDLAHWLQESGDPAGAAAVLDADLAAQDQPSPEGLDIVRTRKSLAAWEAELAQLNHCVTSR